MMTIAAPPGTAFGAVGAGGLALVLTVVLILGVRGRGKQRLRDNGALAVAFLAGTAYRAAGEFWVNAEQVTTQGLTGLGVGGRGPFGELGIGAVCCLLVALVLLAPLTPGRAALLGLVAALVFPTAGVGTIWHVPVSLAAAVLLMIGGGG
ncbi:hypothetical protein AB0M28_13550 [Streptomyces sp. NPDC051940]|uniref:hypothetical protein n=1 Tax=Streptomyces sp. NPDC051940 TaxID=3155675 RepID=UPI00341D3981